MEEAFYLDSNVFIYAAINKDLSGEKARFLIKKFRTGKIKVFTSALTFDEVFWIVKKETGFENALTAAKALLEMPNLYIIDTTKDLLFIVYELIKDYKIDPRDAIHAASALSKNIKVIISNDKHFDQIEGLKRKIF